MTKPMQKTLNLCKTCWKMARHTTENCPDKNQSSWETRFNKRFARKSKGLTDKGTYPDSWFLKEFITAGSMREFIRTEIIEKIFSRLPSIDDPMSREEILECIEDLRKSYE